MAKKLTFNLGFTCPNLDKASYRYIRDICIKHDTDPNKVIDYAITLIRALHDHPDYLTDTGRTALVELTQAFKLQHPES